MITKYLSPKNIGKSKDVRITVRDGGMGVLDVWLIAPDPSNGNRSILTLDYFGGGVNHPTRKDLKSYSTTVSDEESIRDFCSLIDGALNEGMGAVVTDEGCVITVNRVENDEGNKIGLLFLAHNDIRSFKRFVNGKQPNWKYVAWQLFLSPEVANDFVKFFGQKAPEVFKFTTEPETGSSAEKE